MGCSASAPEPVAEPPPPVPEEFLVEMQEKVRGRFAPALHRAERAHRPLSGNCFPAHTKPTLGPNAPPQVKQTVRRSSMWEGDDDETAADIARMCNEMKEARRPRPLPRPHTLHQD